MVPNRLTVGNEPKSARPNGIRSNVEQSSDVVPVLALTLALAIVVGSGKVGHVSKPYVCPTLEGVRKVLVYRHPKKPFWWVKWAKVKPLSRTTYSSPKMTINN